MGCVCVDLMIQFPVPGAFFGFVLMARFYHYSVVTTLHPLQILPVILIDDDTDDLQFMQDGLQKLCERQILCFSDPLVALSHLQDDASHAYSIICDLHMPKLDGYEMREKMLADEKLINASPFFLLSSVITEREIRKMSLLKVHHCYTKAYNEEQLLVNLNHMLSCTAAFYNGHLNYRDV